MSNKVVLTSTDLDGFLTDNDHELLSKMNSYYSEAVEIFKSISSNKDEKPSPDEREKLIDNFNKMGEFMKEIVANEPRINVYSFETPTSIHGEASRLIAKLRDVNTKHGEFLYYTQRAYELLFNLTLYGDDQSRKNYLIVKLQLIILFRIMLYIKYRILMKILKQCYVCYVKRSFASFDYHVEGNTGILLR